MAAAFSPPQQASPGLPAPAPAPRPLRDRLAAAAGRPADPLAASPAASGPASGRAMPALAPPEPRAADVVPLDAARAGLCESG